MNQLKKTYYNPEPEAEVDQRQYARVSYSG